MIKSMTGFGRGEVTKDKKKFLVEIKTVNHRYCDINIRMPKKFNQLETKLKNLVQKYIKRGKVDVFITFEDYSDESYKIKVNKPLIQGYLNAFNDISNEYSIENDVAISFITKLPDVITIDDEKIDEAIIWKLLGNALETSLKTLVEMRIAEGQRLRKDLLVKLDELRQVTEKIEARSPFVVVEYKEKLEKRLQELLKGNDIDETRLATEVAIFADKCSIDEELIRLFSHIQQMIQDLDSNEPIGRKLDFIAQEMNREANTIASKSNDLIITQLAIDLKSVIEKIREQVQNIE